MQVFRKSLTPTEDRAWDCDCGRWIYRSEWPSHPVCQMRADHPHGERNAAPMGTTAAERAPTRWSTGLAGLDRCLGGGIVPGTRILLTGDPGCGKSTLLLLALWMMATRLRCLYVTSEETVPEVEARFQTLLLTPRENLRLCSTKSWEEASRVVERFRPHVVVYDSLPKFRVSALHKVPAGSTRHHETIMRETARMVSERQMSIFIVNHVNAEGKSKGGTDAIHELTTYLHFHRRPTARILRTVKNRKGADGEVSVWEFPPNSAILREKPDFSRVLLEGVFSEPGAVGYPQPSSQELARPMTLPLEASVSLPRPAGAPRVRTATGVPMGVVDDLVDRLADLNIKLHDRSVRVQLTALDDEECRDPAVALAVAVALLGAYERVPLGRIAAFGTLGASGRVQADTRLSERIQCAAQVVETIYGPERHELLPLPAGVEYIAVRTLEDLVGHVTTRAAFRRVQMHREAPPDAANLSA